MNPDAKEFVPAHLMKKKQEEDESVNQLSDRMNKVGIESAETENSAKDVQEVPQENSKGSRTHPVNSRSSKPGETHPNSNGHNDSTPSDGLQDLIDDEYEKFLQSTGENLCEFNGEQYVIPGE